MENPKEYQNPKVNFDTLEDDWNNTKNKAIDYVLSKIPFLDDKTNVSVSNIDTFFIMLAKSSKFAHLAHKESKKRKETSNV